MTENSGLQKAQTRFTGYVGDGRTAAARGTEIPLDGSLQFLREPEGYLAPPGLADAVNVALTLGLPLLLTGDPGTGKTLLAHSVAYELGLGDPLVFSTKSTSVARDLFYRYDALRHFQDSQQGTADLTKRSYVDVEALGLAILLTLDSARRSTYVPTPLRTVSPRRSVVLIDEIDKAPRDLPNDVLHEIEELSFAVRETGESFQADDGLRPIIILTSNSEKSLPEAFLRRCVFFHLEFPAPALLRKIVVRRLGGALEGAIDVDRALAHFERLRKLDLRKMPSTAELLAWLKWLTTTRLDPDDRARHQEVVTSYSILAKDVRDLDAMKAHLLGH